MYHLQYLSRQEYLSSIETIQDPRTMKFATMCLEWWDRQFGWYTKGCITLSDETDLHLSYIFFKIDRTNEYITIHNIFTQLSMRQKGYARELLTMVFDAALSLHVKRFKLTSISNSLDFYLALGFIYWGVNRVGDYYCDLPMPYEGLKGVKRMTQTSTTSELLGKKCEKIYAKVENNDTRLSDPQTLVYTIDLLKMKSGYRLQALSDHLNDKCISE